MKEKNNNRNRRLLQILVCLIFVSGSLLGLAPIAVAQGTPSIGISPSTKTVSQGGTFTLNISVNPNSTEIRGAQCDLTFNPAFVIVNSVTMGNLAEGAPNRMSSNGTIDSVTGTVNVIFDVAATGPNITVQRTFVTLSLTANSTATGDTTIGVLNAGITDPQGALLQVPDIIVTNGTVSIQALPWDLNNNGQVDVGDLVIVGNHFGATGTPGWIQCDFNNNGQIDVGDLVIVGNHFGETI